MPAAALRLRRGLFRIRHGRKMKWPGRPDLTEGEGVSLHTGVEERDLEGMPGDGPRLPDELVKPLFGGGAVALAVKVRPVGRARRLTVEEHPESHRGSRRCWPHDEVEIAGVESVGDLPVGFVCRGGPLLYGPVPG
jgi:hypothetical protein